MAIKHNLLALAVFAALVFQGCSGAEMSHRTSAFHRPEKAARFFQELDRLTHLYGVGDASRFPVEGFPYLRTDRFFEALKDRIDGDAQERCWIRQMQQMDLESRRKEIANLPKAAVTEIADTFGMPAHENAVFQQTEFYSDQLLAQDYQNALFVENVKRAVFVPDEYATLHRWVGLYPLAGIPVTIATTLSYGRFKKWHQSGPGELPVLGQLMHFGPPENHPGSEAVAADPLFDPANLDVLGLPGLSQDQLHGLVKNFAPLITQDVNAPYDRFGKVRWREGRIFIDPSSPAVYYYISFTFLNGKPALQLNYAFWYSERSGHTTPWIEKGPLDGLTYRITLAGNGQPAMLDIMNNCGCYYFIIPPKAHIHKIIIKPGEIEPLIPAWMPDEFPEKRIQLRVNSGWHQVQRVTAGDPPPQQASYALIPYETLESLPKENGRHESVFTSKGIMKDSRRIEPYIFFSMGIPKVGFMRQRGHHAVKLVGREHFSNPFLFDKNFVYEP